MPENPYGASASPILAGKLLVYNHQGKDAYLLGLNRRIYIACAEGVVTVIDAGAKLNVLATNRLDGAILATPALAAGHSM